MEPTAIFRVELDPRQQRHVDRFVQLRPGETIHARVLHLEADGRALIDLGGYRALATLMTDLHRGQHLVLKVISSGEQLVLQIVDQKMRVPPLKTPRIDLAGTLRAALPHWGQMVEHLETALAQMPIAKNSAGSETDLMLQALQRLKQVPTPAPLTESIEELMRWLKTSVEENGLFLETRLADLSMSGTESAARAVLESDLKAQLLLLRDTLQRSSIDTLTDAPAKPKEISAFKALIAQMISHIEHHQEDAVHRGQQPDAQQMFAYVLPTDDPRRPIRLKVFYPKRGSDAEKQKHHRVAVLLDMDYLHAVRADLTLLDRHLQIALYVRDSDIQELFQNHLEGVVDQLQPMFDQIQINVYVSEEKITRFDTEDADEALGGINIQA